jgi:hypothetical protein
MQQATTFEQGGKVYEVRAIPTLNGWKQRSVIFGVALPLPLLPPKRLPTRSSKPPRAAFARARALPWFGDRTAI